MASLQVVDTFVYTGKAVVHLVPSLRCAVATRGTNSSRVETLLVREGRYSVSRPAPHIHILCRRHLEEALQQASLNYQRISEEMQVVGRRYMQLKQEIIHLNVCAHWS